MRNSELMNSRELLHREDVVHLQNLKKSFSNFTLSISDFSVHKGETIAIMGESGAGKTTLLNIIGGFILPDEGRVRVFGTKPHLQFDQRRDIRTLFQDLALFPHLSVRRQWRLALHSSSSDGDPEKTVTRWADLLGLSNKLDSLPHELSGGQKQRVALGRALISSPKLLLLDEPMTSMGRGLRMDIWSALDDIELTEDTTLIVVTHDPEIAFLHSDRIIVLEDGQAIQQNSPQELYARPTKLSVARLLGDMNVVTHNGKSFMVRPEELYIDHDLKASHVRLGAAIIKSYREMGNKVVMRLRLGGNDVLLSVRKAKFETLVKSTTVPLTCPKSALLELKD